VKSFVNSRTNAQVIPLGAGPAETTRANATITFQNRVRNRGFPFILLTFHGIPIILR